MGVASAGIEPKPKGMVMSKIISLLLVSVAITGCASSGVVPMGQDTYMISKQSATGFSSGGAVKADIYREGSAFCASNGKEFQPVSDRGVDGIPGRAFANSEVQFRCLDKSDPELGRRT